MNPHKQSLSPGIRWSWGIELLRARGKQDGLSEVFRGFRRDLRSVWLRSVGARAPYRVQGDRDRGPEDQGRAGRPEAVLGRADLSRRRERHDRLSED